MEPSVLRIVGLGACTPVGRNAWSSAAAVRAGVCGFSEHPFMLDTVGEPVRIARAPWLDASVGQIERCGELLFPAVDEALRPALAGLQGRPCRIGVALALPPVRPGRPSALSRHLMDALPSRCVQTLVPVLISEAGHAAGHMALEAAMQGCARGLVDACVVAGVDSYLAPETLEWVEACDQLHGGGPLNNAWGFVPGEAAGAILVACDAFARQTGAEIFGEVAGIGIGRERNLIKTGSVCIGEGLTHAFREALKGIGSCERIHNVFCDLNGEPYRADEYGFAALRTGERLRAATDFIAPADCWGDIGAAGVPLHTALAVISHRKRYGKGPLSMVWASSETGERGAAVIRATDTGPEEA